MQVLWRRAKWLTLNKVESESESESESEVIIRSRFATVDCFFLYGYGRAFAHHSAGGCAPIQ
jgi:hypothetical protein